MERGRRSSDENQRVVRDIKGAPGGEAIRGRKSADPGGKGSAEIHEHVGRNVLFRTGGEA